MLEQKIYTKQMATANLQLKVVAAVFALDIVCRKRKLQHTHNNPSPYCTTIMKASGWVGRMM
jgi:hypothetical protein